MPQLKIQFVGDRLDNTMPPLVQTRMKRDEWNAFCREINFAIRTTQMKMRFTPWIICCLVLVAVMIILLEVALNFSHPQIMTLILTILVVCGLLVICRYNTVPPTNYCEAQVTKICEEYSDAERNLYFFYRHHNEQVLITENRFYIEVFVGEGNEVPIDDNQRQMNTAAGATGDNVIWQDENDEDDDRKPAASQELVPISSRREYTPTTTTTTSTTALALTRNRTNTTASTAESTTHTNTTRASAIRAKRSAGANSREIV